MIRFLLLNSNGFKYASNKGLIDAADYTTNACTHDTSNGYTHRTQGYSQCGPSSEPSYKALALADYLFLLLGPDNFSILSLRANSFRISSIIDVVGINFSCEIVEANSYLIDVDGDFFEISYIEHSLNQFLLIFQQKVRSYWGRI